MLLEVLRNYLDVVNGATKLTQRSATSMARNMLLQAGMEPTADLVHQFSEQLIAAQDAQYSMIRQMIQSEVSLTMESMGFASQPRGPDSSQRTPAEAPSASAAPVKDIAEPAAEATATAEATSPAEKAPAQKSTVQVAQPRKTPATTKAAPAAKKAATTKAAPTAKKATAARAAPAAKKATAKKVTRKAPAGSTASRTAAKKATASEATDDTTSS